MKGSVYRPTRQASTTLKGDPTIPCLKPKAHAGRICSEALQRGGRTRAAVSQRKTGGEDGEEMYIGHAGELCRHMWEVGTLRNLVRTPKEQSRVSAQHRRSQAPVSTTDTQADA